MDITPLSQVRPGVYHYIICVRISRVWEFHGKNDDDPIKHLDLVIIDQQGTAMYAEVPQEAIYTLQPRLQESKILIMRKIYVDNAKLSFKPVHGKYMIRLHPKTLLEEVNEDPQDFPKYTFHLTPFPELPQLEGNNEYFIDVIGCITALSDATPFQTSSGIVRMKRLIHLVDLRGNKIEVSLWGRRAEEFPGQQVFKASEMNHVIVIFVGTSVKSYRGSPPFLSGTAACRWYINLPEIHEINTFYASIGEQYQSIQKLHIQTMNEMQNKIEQKTFLEMKLVDPFDDMSKRFECTMIVTRIADNKPWFYQGCTKCNTSTRYEGKTYICKQGHISSQMVHRYKISLYATDGTYELEFVLFDERATSLIGKTVEKLLRQSNKSELPEEIKAIVGEKLTVVTKLFPGKSIKKRGPNKDNKDPTFDILSIKKRHGKDLLLSVFKKEEPVVLHSASSSQLPKLPPLVPIEPKTQDIQTSGSEAASPHELQLMEIDQTSCFDNLSVSYKRNFNAIDDSDKEETHGADQLSVFAKRPKMKNN
ncbi:replication protein A 70 kDa DNA-binding subunit A isoform X2 [Zea mays]|uniref:Replication factor A C-terminal domain-containing protein n=1 Tax=Zea mays TaxID=4577 RepID=A0A804NR96_MAIZE|nr:replication protein A 70 kDa DNA-binding subunit A isoform X2 [Zea mays]|eukprot:XP_008678601.1 replication protein A 70 kDa DNA-binding subunit A isoform X2 [Zea mays]